MPKRLGSKEVIRVLQEHGFSFVTQRGSHAKYKKPPAELPSFPIRKRNCPLAPPAPSSANPA